MPQNGRIWQSISIMLWYKLNQITSYDCECLEIASSSGVPFSSSSPSDIDESSSESW